MELQGRQKYQDCQCLQKDRDLTYLAEASVVSLLRRLNEETSPRHPHPASVPSLLHAWF